MIIVSLKLFDFIALGTFHIKLGIDLPVYHFAGKLSVVSYDVTTGPRSVAAPAHSRAAVEVTEDEVDHSEPMAPGLDPWS